MSVFPSLELIVSFASPSQSINTPRDSCFSMKSIAPSGYAALDLMESKSCMALAGS